MDPVSLFYTIVGNILHEMDLSIYDSDPYLNITNYEKKYI